MSEEIEERGGIPPLRSGAGMSGKLRLMGVAFIVLVFLVIVGAIAFKKVKEGWAAEKEEKGPEKVASENRDTDLKEPPDFVREALSERAGAGFGTSEDAGAAAADGTDQQLEPPPAAAGRAATGASGAGTPEEDSEADKQARRQRAPVMVFSRTAPSLSNNMARSQEQAKEQDPYEAMMLAALSNANPGQASNGPAPLPLSEQLRSDSYPAAIASRATNRSFTVRQGTMGRCTMRTSFNSQLSGFASCILSDPLYSADGRFVMAEAGSEVIGQYQTGQVKPGVSRAFVLWTSIETPHGVKISLDSPATDGMGQSGITGRVNNHFWKRFGSGLVLSMVDDGVSAVSRNAENFRQTSRSMNEAAAIAVQSSVDIPPTIRVFSGAVVNIFVARDLDFSTVYSARLTDSLSDSY